VYKLAFFVPETHLDVVKAAVFGAGGGRIGNYDHCCWQVLGRGQFRTLAGAEPFVGEQDKLVEVGEWRVEMVCADDLVRHAVVALKKTHPYEEPAFEVWPLTDVG
tara:strand:+ start:2185 stop:2499 length:315 start_codon:yes stop_codon:yes gene_type:complete